MAILREQAQFDTSGAKGFDRGGIEWALQSLTYTLKIYDTSDNKVAEIAGDLENVTLTELVFKTNRKGGCAEFSFELAEPYTTATIAYNYKVEIYFFNHFSAWFTGYIEEVPEAGTDKRQEYAGYGYFEKFNKKLINVTKTAQEISVIATAILDDDIIANYSAITKNTDKIEATGYTLVGSLQFERQFARDVFDLLADVANDYEFGVDQDGEFFFRAIDTTILERFWVGTHLTEFTPEKDYSKIVNKWYIYAPPFSDGSNYQITVENSASQSSYGLAEDFIDAPAIISIYSSTNLASGITPSTSPTGSGAANMTDGSSSTLWESGADQTVGHYIKIDLGSTFDSVAKVVLDSINSSAREYHATLFKIETSTDDASYTQVFSASSDPGWKPVATFQPVAARYILITLTAAVAKHWKVGEVEIHELDTTDLERWGAQLITDSKDPMLRAEVVIKGIDKILAERPIVAAIHPTGKCRVTDRDGTTTRDYAIISCEYSLSSSGLDLTMELGHPKREVSDWIRTLRRQIAENRLLGIRRGDNIASGTGLGQGIIKSTMIGENAIETPHLRANLITTDKLGANVVTAGKIVVAVTDDITDGKTAFDGTVKYRSTGAPTNNPAPSAITKTTKANATMDIKLQWGTYTQGAKQADAIMLFWKKGTAALGAPTVNDSALTFNVNTGAASYFIFEGVNPDDNWSFGIAAVRRTENGLEIGTIQSPTSAPDWQDVTEGTANYTANLDGETATNVHTWADDPAARVNAVATLIEPGKLSLSWESGKIVIGQDALGADKPGMAISDGTYIRAEFGKINGDYGAIFRDAAGNVTVDMGAVMGAAEREWVSASNTITTTSTTYTDMPNMSITQTLPKCLVFMWSVVFLDTTGLSSGDCRHIFWIDSGTVGIYSGAEIGKKIVTVNMWSQSLAADSHTFKIQWKSNGAADTAETWNRQLGLIYWEVQ